MIYTLTANPAIDYNIACDGLSANTVTRTRDAVYTPNGKGLNVSFTLDHYGVDTTILGFFAGFSGEFIVKGAEALGVPVKPVWTDGITRVNVFLNAGPDTEYNMVNAGAAINAASRIDTSLPNTRFGFPRRVFLHSGRMWRLLSRSFESTMRLHVRACSFLARLLENHR